MRRHLHCTAADEILVLLRSECVGGVASASSYPSRVIEAVISAHTHINEPVRKSIDPLAITWHWCKLMQGACAGAESLTLVFINTQLRKYTSTHHCG
jgi:hypothetical protein